MYRVKIHCLITDLTIIPPINANYYHILVPPKHINHNHLKFALREYCCPNTVMEKPKVFVTVPYIPKNGILMLQERYDVEIWPAAKGQLFHKELVERVKGKSAIFCLPSDKIDNSVLASAGDALKVVGTFSVGVDHIDLSAMKRHGIKLGHTPGVLTDATAELTVALLLATSRRLVEANRLVHSGGCSNTPLFYGPALKGSVVGIVGYGRIGQSVAEKLSVFKVSKILYTSRTEKQCPLGGVRKALETLLSESDFVIATCALTPETRLLFNKERFALMKPTAIFINTSRGDVVDQDALVSALQNGIIRACGLDVTTPEPLPVEHPLLQLSNCLVLPHIGSDTYEASFAMSELTAQNIISALEGQEVPSEYPL